MRIIEAIIAILSLFGNMAFAILDFESENVQLYLLIAVFNITTSSIVLAYTVFGAQKYKRIAEIEKEWWEEQKRLQQRQREYEKATEFLMQSLNVNKL